MNNNDTEAKGANPCETISTIHTGDNEKDPLEETRSQLSFTRMFLALSLVCNLVMFSFVHQGMQIQAISATPPTVLQRQLSHARDIVPATVTVTVEGTTYHGNDDQPPATIRIEQGCGVYENIRQDGKPAKVTCCGDGDCLLGFLTQHQWMLQWLR